MILWWLVNREYLSSFGDVLFALLVLLLHTSWPVQVLLPMRVNSRDSFFM